MNVAKLRMPSTHHRCRAVAAGCVAVPLLLATLGLEPARAADTDKAAKADPVVQKSAHPGVGEMVVVPASRHSVLRATVGSNGKVSFERRQPQATSAAAAAPAR